MIYTMFDDLRDPQGAQFSSDWSGFCGLIANATDYPSKDTQPLIKLATFEGDSRASDCALLEVYGIEIDYDAGLVQLQDAAAMLQSAGIKAIVCSTYTSKSDFPKWRIFAPTSKPYEARHRAALVAGLDAVIGNIAAHESYTPKQTFFIGRNPASDYTVIVTAVEGECFDTLTACQQIARDYATTIARNQLNAELEALKIAEMRINRRNQSESNGLIAGQLSVINNFNAAYDVGAILRQHGYKPDSSGKRYLCPSSASGLHGVVLLDEGRKCYSHHTNDPLADGRAHDAFDCFSILVHGGDENRAIRAAGALMYVGSTTINQFNKKVFKRYKLLNERVEA